MNGPERQSSTRSGLKREDRIDINGKRESELKKHERMAWIDPEILNYIRKTNRNPQYCEMVPRIEWPFSLGHRTVVKTRSGSVCGVFLAFVRMQRQGAVLAAIDSPGKGRVLVDPETIVALTPEAADAWMPVSHRNAGHRLLRTMRDCGAHPGEEDKFLQRILTIYNRDKEYLALLQSNRDFLANCRDDLSDSARAGMVDTNYATVRALKVPEVKIPNLQLTGERCYSMLCEFGLNPSNTYHGLYDVLRVYYAQRLAVADVDKEALVKFMNKADPDGADHIPHHPVPRDNY